MFFSRIRMSKAKKKERKKNSALKKKRLFSILCPIYSLELNSLGSVLCFRFSYIHDVYSSYIKRHT